VLNTFDQELIAKVASNWKLTPATFAQKLSGGKWIPAPWLLYVSQIIAQAIARGNGRIIISAPPRHGKSELVDVYLPAWVLELFPEYQVILTSYGADLSEEFGRKCRDLILDNTDLLNTRVKRDAQRVDNFKTVQGGSVRSVGLGGSITGKGANVLIVDDYVKEIKEALSQTYRDYAWNWFTTTAYTRIEPGGTCIIIATRWHSDDLIGRLLERFPGKWTNIVLPAIAEQNDILGRDPGMPLFPERYNIDVLMERLEVLGPSFFQALFQQRPVDEAKKLADGQWLKVVDLIPFDKLKLMRVWDLAATADGGDYTTGTLCGYDQHTGFFYILNVVREQLNSGDVEQLVLRTAVADGIRTEIGIEQEPGSAGKSLCEHFRTTILPEFVVHNIPVVNAKVVRAQPLLAAAELGKVFLWKGRWNDIFIKEFDTFPGLYDDQVDTAGAGYTLLTGKKHFSATWGRNTKARTNIVQANKQARASILGLSGPKGSGATWGRR
jgi:predicted phage terminase large subunit-like protein